MTDYEIDMLLEDIESGEIINKNKRGVVRIEPLRDGGTYKVKFKDCSINQVAEWMRAMKDGLIERNIVLVPEISQLFEFEEEN